MPLPFRPQAPKPHDPYAAICLDGERSSNTARRYLSLLSVPRLGHSVLAALICPIAKFMGIAAPCPYVPSLLSAGECPPPAAMAMMAVRPAI